VEEGLAEWDEDGARIARLAPRPTSALHAGSRAGVPLACSTR
jgi:hypothetical protein